MADIKEVKVTLTAADEKQFARSTTRKRKMKGGDNTNEIEDFRLNKLNGNEPKPVPDLATVLAPVVPITSNNPSIVAPVRIVQKAAPAAAVAPVSLNATSAAALPPTNPLNGGSVTRIIPKKKHLTKAPTATTLKKPSLIISAAVHPKISAPATIGGSTRRHRFAERKISVPIRSAAATRKQTQSLKDKIHGMPAAAVRKMLLRKGLIKASAKTPDDMARSLLMEYMLLHRAE